MKTYPENTVTTTNLAEIAYYASWKNYQLIDCTTMRDEQGIKHFQFAFSYTDSHPKLDDFKQGKDSIYHKDLLSLCDKIKAFLEKREKDLTKSLREAGYEC